MRTGRIYRLANFIEKLPPKLFDMNSGMTGKLPNHTCGTAACIAGWAGHLWPEECHHSLTENGEELAWSYHKTRRALGISKESAVTLFYDYPLSCSRQHAAAVLRHLAKTGKVDWSIEPKGAVK